MKVAAEVGCIHVLNGFTKLCLCIVPLTYNTFRASMISQILSNTIREFTIARLMAVYLSKTSRAWGFGWPMCNTQRNLQIYLISRHKAQV
jgi:hypothetical protein